MSTALGEGPRLIRPVAPTAWIDPRSATRGLKNQNHFFLLREERERQHHTREKGSRSSGPLQGHHRERTDHVSKPSGHFTCQQHRCDLTNHARAGGSPVVSHSTYRRRAARPGWVDTFANHCAVVGSRVSCAALTVHCRRSSITRGGPWRHPSRCPGRSQARAQGNV